MRSRTCASQSRPSRAQPLWLCSAERPSWRSTRKVSEGPEQFLIARLISYLDTHPGASTYGEARARLLQLMDAEERIGAEAFNEARARAELIIARSQAKSQQISQKYSMQSGASRAESMFAMHMGFKELDLEFVTISDLDTPPKAEESYLRVGDRFAKRSGSFFPRK